MFIKRSEVKSTTVEVSDNLPKCANCGKVLTNQIQKTGSLKSCSCLCYNCMKAENDNTES